MTETSVESEFLFRVRFETEAPLRLDHFPSGTRVVVRVTGGVVEGPALSGVVVSGEDWVIRDAARTELDVRARLLTDTGETVLMTYRGFNKPSPDGTVSILVAVFLEAATTAACSWVNDTICLGTGVINEAGVYYDVVAVRGVSLRRAG